MSTRRERLEARLEKRLTWSESRKAKARAAFDRAHKLTDGIPFGQPILVGHHSENRHRRTLNKADNAMRAGYESADIAKHHAGKAIGLEHALETSIFSDDPDAIEALQAKIADLEAKRARMVKTNALWRKGNDDGLRAHGVDPDALRARLAAAGGYWGSAPHLPYEMQNLGGNITRLRKRIEDLKRRQDRAAKAEASESGVIVEGTGEYVRVTFAEKPERSVIDALKAAGFMWGGGSWTGKREKLPAQIGGA